MTKQKMTQEAVNRLEELISRYDLNPNILKYFKEGRVYYSYLTGGGLLASIDTIAYDPRYEKAVHDFEQKYGCLVYHAVESISEQYGEMLSLLYVGQESEEWEGERLYKNYIYTYTINFTHPEWSEFGDIIVGNNGWSGALIRLG